MTLKTMVMGLILAAAVPAALADPMRVTVTASGSTGWDFTDIPAAPPGQPFELSWTAEYDTDYLVTQPSPYRQYASLWAGTSTFTYNGYTITQQNTNDRRIDVAHFGKPGQPPSWLQLSSPSFVDGAYYLVSFSITPPDGVLPEGILSTPGTLAYTAADGLSGMVDSWMLDGSGNGYRELVPVSLQITVSAIPEPATWSMLFAGLALVGTVATRRRPA